MTGAAANVCRRRPKSSKADQRPLEELRVAELHAGVTAGHAWLEHRHRHGTLWLLWPSTSHTCDAFDG